MLKPHHLVGTCALALFAACSMGEPTPSNENPVPRAADSTAFSGRYILRGTFAITPALTPTAGAGSRDATILRRDATSEPPTIGRVSVSRIDLEYRCETRAWRVRRQLFYDIDGKQVGEVVRDSAWNIADGSFDQLVAPLCSGTNEPLRKFSSVAEFIATDPDSSLPLPPEAPKVTPLP